MVIIQKCVSDRNHMIRYPEFAAGETDGKKEQQAALRMNDFYCTMKDEIIAYCAEIAILHPKVMYMTDLECTVGGNTLSLCESADFAVEVPLTVRIALTLRIRPEPTRHRIMVHTWQSGVIVK